MSDKICDKQRPSVSQTVTKSVTAICCCQRLGYSLLLLLLPLCDKSVTAAICSASAVKDSVARNSLLANVSPPRTAGSNDTTTTRAQTKMNAEFTATRTTITTTMTRKKKIPG